VARSLTNKIAWNGLESLSQEERALLPPDYEEGVGNALYKQRVQKIIKDQHPTVGEEFLENFWVSQSVWDDTMAWNAVEYINQNPDQILVILVGNGHVEFGGGLPDRIRVRAEHIGCDVCRVVTVPQALLPEGVESFDNFAAEISEDEQYGQYGDYLWLSDEEETIAEFVRFMKEHKRKKAQEAAQKAAQEARAKKAQNKSAEPEAGQQRVGLKLSEAAF
jgi:heme exporter protein D